MLSSVFTGEKVETWRERFCSLIKDMQTGFKWRPCCQLVHLTLGSPGLPTRERNQENREEGLPGTPSDSFLETPLLQGAELLPAIQVGLLVAKRDKGKTHHVSQ